MEMFFLCSGGVGFFEVVFGFWLRIVILSFLVGGFGFSEDCFFFGVIIFLGFLLDCLGFGVWWLFGVYCLIGCFDFCVIYFVCFF